MSEDIAALLQRDPAQNLCSCFGHSWTLARPEGPGELGVRFRLVCERCTTQRLDSFSHTGRLITRSYKYPEGYMFARGTKPTREVLRLAIIRQQWRPVARTRRAS